MAMMECVECGNQISSKAEFCPHCGRPTANRRKSSVYRLRIGKGSRNGFAGFLQVAAVIVAIAGIIIAIASSNVTTLDRYGYRETAFSWSVFFTSLASFAEYTFVLWSLGTVVDLIQETHDMVAGLQLEREEETPEPVAKQSRSIIPRYESQNGPQINSQIKPDNNFSKGFDADWLIVEDQIVKCPECGKEMTYDFINILRNCPQCGRSYQPTEPFEKKQS